MSCWRKVTVSSFGGVWDSGGGRSDLGGTGNLVLLRHGDDGVGRVERWKGGMPD